MQQGRSSTFQSLTLKIYDLPTKPQAYFLSSALLELLTGNKSVR